MPPQVREEAVQRKSDRRNMVPSVIVPASSSVIVIISVIIMLGAMTMEARGLKEVDQLLETSKLQMFVDDLPDIPKVYGYRVVDGKPVPRHLKIAMFSKKWKFHRDLPATPVFAFGTTKHTATIPGPTIEALHGIDTYIRWENRLPCKHILPWDPTIPTAVPPNKKGIPTVVHVHGGIDEPSSDGHSHAWFTSNFNERGPTWQKKTYHYHNKQHPGNLWYHDHAMGLTRVNILAGLFGAYVIRQPEIEDPLGLPSGDEFDKVLAISDRGFYANGSLYMNLTGDNPNIHPQWQPEYFGDVIVVNGKAWPRMTVHRRKYRFRIINASNARFFRLHFLKNDDNGLNFIHVGSDSAYIERPVTANHTLVAPSEIIDVIIDFENSKSDVAILANDAPYPYPSGDPVNEANSMVMKFIIKNKHHSDQVHSLPIPEKLLQYPRPRLSSISLKRYITMYEYTSKTDEPTHLYINGLSYDDPVTEKPKVGTTELWYVINLTDDNHPLHIHLALFVVLDQTKLVEKDEFKECMNRLNDAIKCNIKKYARGKKIKVPAHEMGWKNVYKMRPGFVTRILVRFSYIHTNSSYPFDATAEPGYVYHCHILDHEDNVMMRPFRPVN